MVSYFFCLLNFKFPSGSMWISSCKKNLSSETIEQGQTHYFVVKPFKIWHPEDVVGVIFPIETEIVTIKLW